MMQCPSDDSNPIRKTHIFVRANTIYDAFVLKGYTIIRTAHDM